MQIKAFAIAALAASSLTFPAFADSASWAGRYVGFGLGESFTETSVEYSHRTASCGNNTFGGDGGGGCGGSQNYDKKFDQSLERLTGTFHAAYLWDIDGFVAGLEPSFAYKRGDDTYSEVVPGYWGDTLNVKSEQNYTVNLRGTFGVPVDRFLLYVSGGPSVGLVKTGVKQLANGVADKQFENTQWKFGYSAGGGVKYALTNRWVIGGECIFTDLTDSHLSEAASGGVFPNTSILSDNSNLLTQVTLAFHF